MLPHVILILSIALLFGCSKTQFDASPHVSNTTPIASNATVENAASSVAEIAVIAQNEHEWAVHLNALANPGVSSRLVDRPRCPGIREDYLRFLVHAASFDAPALAADSLDYFSKNVAVISSKRSALQLEVEQCRFPR
jgi:hypothetical protein